MKTKVHYAINGTVCFEEFEGKHISNQILDKGVAKIMVMTDTEMVEVLYSDAFRIERTRSVEERASNEH